MELFIQIRDGQPYEHPILGENFRQAFPHIDPDHLPPEFARFVRVPPPVVGPDQIVVGPAYVWDGAVVTDAWQVEPRP